MGDHLQDVSHGNTRIGAQKPSAAEKPMIVLGIESSCDETAAAVVDDTREICANVVRSQVADHAAYGGVVPEIAARSHLEHLDGIIARAMDEAGVEFDQLDGIAATAGPGLIGAVMVGLMTGKAIAAAHSKPLVALNHLEGHALSPRLVDPAVTFPYLLLLVSGGHCQLIICKGIGRYRRLGTTIDDAAGEAFDKVAKLLDLGYPGGPIIEKTALDGDPDRFPLPRPLKGRPGCDFSFSGLKTAVLHTVKNLGSEPDPQAKADIAASFQAAVSDVMADRTIHAIAEYRKLCPTGGSLVVAGGVAANKALKARLTKLAEDADIRLAVPPPALCTDNGAMIAWAGIERLREGLVDTMDTAPRARWPLDPGAERPGGMGAPGRLGPKA